jgi:hypothetical protein
LIYPLPTAFSRDWIPIAANTQRITFERQCSSGADVLAVFFRASLIDMLLQHVS